MPRKATSKQSNVLLSAFLHTILLGKKKKLKSELQLPSETSFWLDSGLKTVIQITFGFNSPGKCPPPFQKIEISSKKKRIILCSPQSREGPAHGANGVQFLPQGHIERSGGTGGPGGGGT